MKRRIPGLKPPKKSLFPDLPTPPTVADEKHGSPLWERDKTVSIARKRKRRKQLFN